MVDNGNFGNGEATVSNVVFQPIFASIRHFHPNEMSFSSWLELFDEFCLINGIDDEPVHVEGQPAPPHNQKRALFLSYIGTRTYQTLHTSCLPHKPRQKSLRELIKIIKDRYEPKSLLATCRYNLNQRIQRDNESATDYLDALMELAIPCDYGTHLNETLRDRLIVGIKCNDTRRKLLSTPNLTFELAKQIVLQSEAIQQQSLLLARALPVNSIHSTNHIPNRKSHSFPGNRPFSQQQNARQQQNYNRQQVNRHKSCQPSQRQQTQGPNNSAMSSSQNHVNKQNSNGCYRCGRMHNPNYCPAKQWQCYVCNKLGHTSKVCRSKNKVHTVYDTTVNQQSSLGASTSHNASEEELVNELIMPELFQINSVHEEIIEQVTTNTETVNHMEINKPAITDIFINNKRVAMEVDSGAGKSLITEKEFKTLFPELIISETTISLNSISGPIKVVGQAEVEIGVTQNKSKSQIIICQSDCPFRPLLGREWLDILFPTWRSQFTKNNINNATNLVDILKTKFPKVFNNTTNSPIKGVQAQIVLKDNISPIFHKAYNLPFTQLEIIDTILNNLEQQKKIYKVSHSEHASPCLLVKKKNNTGMRLCVDFKRTLNKQIRVDFYPLPKPEDIFAHLTNGKVFTVLDLSDAYTQLELDEQSQELITINTHRGLYRFKRLIYGLASAPAIFQKTMDYILNGIPQVFCYIDDILVKGSDTQDCFKTVEKVLDRLNKHGVQIRENKCMWFVDKVEYLGFIITQNGRNPAVSKVEAIMNAKTPGNQKEVRSFLGLLNFYAVFIPNLSTIAKPLRELTEKNKTFFWSDACNEAFQLCKKSLTSQSLLIHFDPNLPIIVSCDASPVGVGAVLAHELHINNRKVEKPIMFASCSLTKTQQNYSQLDREGLAIIFALTKFRKFLWGRKFTIITDNAPIKHILHPDKSIPILSSHRLQHWAAILEAHNYNIVHRKSALLSPPDALSRLPTTSTMEDINFSIESHSLPLSICDIKQQTVEDETLSRVLERTRLGWPRHNNDPALEAYYKVRDQLFIEDKCLLFNNRVVIPLSLQAKVLKLLHEGHPGIVRTKLLARSTVWWPQMNADIETYCKQCDACSKVNFKHQTTTSPWPKTSFPFQRIHIDFYQVNSQNFFIICDSFSKWITVTPMLSCTAINVTAEILSLISNFGIPESIMSDNGPPFDSQLYYKFCTSYNITILHSPPYHPQSNGLAERGVQTCKKAMKKIVEDLRKASLSTPEVERTALFSKITAFLFSYRNTPSTSTGKSPNEFLLSYKPRTLLSLIQPKKHHSQVARMYAEGDKVNLRVGKAPVITGTVVKQLSATRYLVSVQGVLKQPHVNQMSHAN